MPNYITNTVCMKGIENLPLYDADGNFDFNKIIPMPKELDIEEGSLGDRNLMYYLSKKGTVSPDHFTGKRKDIAKKLLADMFGFHPVSMCFKRMKETIKSGSIPDYEDGKLRVSNFMKYGHATWYGWCNKNWNTKWNAMETMVIDTNTISFLTAWDSPSPIFEKLSFMYPSAKIEVEWVDEGNPYIHKEMYQNGTQTILV